MVLSEQVAGSLAEAGMDTTAEALVGAGDDVEGLLAVEGLGLGVLEDGVGGLAVGAGGVHCGVGLVETGGGDDLHGVCDLFDVLDRLETALDLTESSEAGSRGGAENIE